MNFRNARFAVLNQQGHTCIPDNLQSIHTSKEMHETLRAFKQKANNLKGIRKLTDGSAGIKAKRDEEFCFS